MSDVYRPLIGSPFKKIASDLSKKLNETALDEFDELDTIRYCLAEAWKRAYPNQTLPKDAIRLLKRYYIDPGLYNQHNT